MYASTILCRPTIKIVSIPAGITAATVALDRQRAGASALGWPEAKILTGRVDAGLYAGRLLEIDFF